MKHLEEIVRELCWNPSISDAHNYLANDRDLDVTEEEIQVVKDIIGLFISQALDTNPYNDREVNMNDFVDGLEEMVWERYEYELKNLLVESEN